MGSHELVPNTDPILDAEEELYFSNDPNLS